MATQIGKAARKQFGTRAAARRGKSRRATRKRFGTLDVSEKRGNATSWRQGGLDEGGLYD